MNVFEWFDTLWYENNGLALLFCASAALAVLVAYLLVHTAREKMQQRWLVAWRFQRLTNQPLIWEEDDPQLHSLQQTRAVDPTMATNARYFYSSDFAERLLREAVKTHSKLPLSVVRDELRRVKKDLKWDETKYRQTAEVMKRAGFTVHARYTEYLEPSQMEFLETQAKDERDGWVKIQLAQL